MAGRKKDGTNHRIRRGQFSSKVGGPGVRKPGRREWMKECLKLLEQMMELDNSMPFREPVDLAKHPDYYTVVSDPIDLSKVNFKFRGNQYNDPDEFATDMRQLFQNYSKYFKDPSSEIYHQLHELTRWFETQYKRIVDKWGFRWMHLQYSNSSSQGGSTSMEEVPRSSPPPPQPSSLQQHSPAMQHSPMQQSPALPLQQQQQQHMAHSPSGASGSQDMYMPLVQQVHAAAAGAPPYTLMQQQQSNPSLGSLPSQQSGGSAYSGSPVPFTSGIPAPVFTSSPVYSASPHHHPMATYASSPILGYSSTSSPQLSVPHHHPPPPPQQQQQQQQQQQPPPAQPSVPSPHQPPPPASSQPPPEQVPGPLPISIIPIISEPAPEHRPRPLERSRGPMLGQRHRRHDTLLVQDKSSPSLGGSYGSQTESHTSGSEQSLEDQLELTIANSLVWFGQTQFHATRPIVLRETGLSLCVGSGETATGAQTEYPVEIHADEIVRCVAHLGTNMKHKIFVFVLPNCTKRLEELSANMFSGCSLIVLFTSALSPSQISLMIHIFHNMSKNSIFGPLFSETDQDGALLLLSNIKPGIVGRAERVKEAVMSSRSLDVEMCRMQDDDPHTSSSTGPPLPTSHRLTIPFTQERRSLSLNDAPMVAERQQQQSAQSSESRPLDLSAPNTSDNSMWNGAVHPNRNLSRTKFHFKQRSLETSRRPTPRLGALGSSGGGGGPGMGGGGGLLRKAQRQYAVDNGSDEDEETSIAVPALPQQQPRASEASEGNSSTTTTSIKHEPSKQSSLSSSSRGSQSNDSTNSTNNEQCSQQSDEVVMTEVRTSNRCPITQKVMHEPVRNRCCSHVYDKEGVEHLIKAKNGKAHCPVPGCSNAKFLCQADLVQDHDLWKQIQAKIEDHDY